MPSKRDESRLAAVNRLIIRIVCLAIGVWTVIILVSLGLFIRA
ncbi:hypothetical protein [Streptomyces sp. NPDC020681]